jgi:hypothetical protein
MAEGPVESQKAARSGRKRSLAAAALFPALVAMGALTPGLVELAMQSGEAGTPVPIRDGTPSAFERQPLPAPRDPALGFTPVSLELDRLFFDTEYRGVEPSRDFAAGGAGGAGAAPSPAEIAQLLSFPRSDTDPIVLDQLEPYTEELVFKDALVPEQVADAQVPDPSQGFLPLCGVLTSTNCIRFDDFQTVVPRTTPIPEPGSGALVALGLGALAALRRRFSR